MSTVAAPTHPLLAGAEAVADSGRAGFLSDIRRHAAERFEALGVPTRRTEAWRFTGIARLADEPRTLAEPGLKLSADALPTAEGRRVVLVDGWLREELSDLGSLPDGVVACSLDAAAEDRRSLVEAHLARHDELADHPFVALNTARFRGGLLLWIPDGTAIEEPIEVLLVAGAPDRPTLVVPRVLVVAGRNSRAQVIQRSVGGNSQTLSCSVTELVLGDGAVLRHLLTQEDHPEAAHVAATEARQQRDSALSSSVVSTGGGLVRNDLAVALLGPGADATLDGLYMVSGKRHVDNQLRVHHTQPNCTSRQLYKGVLDDAARAVFNGRIVVDPGAQKTDARQSNRNLLLSDSALVNSNPQLEIFADDVRCTHGSTVGRLDEDAVFYLRSRGLGLAAAETLLTWAFAAEVVDRIPVEAVRRRVTETVLSRLPGSLPVGELE